MKKCDCLNFCGDDTRIDPYSESCVDYHHRRTAALKWLADYVPCWDPSATHIMRCTWHPVGYLFFADEITGTQGFAFSLEELDRERVRIGRSAFAAPPQKQNAVSEEARETLHNLAQGLDTLKRNANDAYDRNYIAAMLKDVDGLLTTSAVKGEAHHEG